jgi:hypothetical protein
VDKDKIIASIQHTVKACFDGGKTEDEAQKLVEARITMLMKDHGVTGPELGRVLRMTTDPWTEKAEKTKEKYVQASASTIPTWKPEQPVLPPPQAQEDEWVSTMELQAYDRREAILDFLEETPLQMRSEIEVGAGYRLADVRLPPDEYDKVKRRVQRDVQELKKQGLIREVTKPNPKHVRGQNDTIYLYEIMPEENETDTPTFTLSPELKKLLTAALVATNRDELTTLLKEAARVAGVTPLQT